MVESNVVGKLENRFSKFGSTCVGYVEVEVTEGDNVVKELKVAFSLSSTSSGIPDRSI
jgi:hypothetical protein